MLDIAIIAIYFVAMAAVGIYDYRRRKASTSGFFVINRRGTTLDIAGSLCATLIGASATLGMAGLAYSRGLSGAWWLLAGVIGLFILGFFFARRVRSAGLYTLPELVQKQYNSKAAGFVTSVLIVVSWLAVIAAQILASGKILSVLFPSVDISTWMIITSSVITLYTFLGGQYSVIGTDIIQFGIIIVGVFVGAGLVMNHVGGISGLHASLPPGFFSFPVSPNLNFGWLDLMSLLILVGSVYVVGPDMYSRLFCARDEKVARKSVFIAGLATIPVAFGIVLIGMGAMVLFPGIAQEQAFPRVIKDVLPIGVSGLVGAALLAAMMSSADTCLLTTSTILSVDIFKPFFPNMSERKTLIISRLCVLFIGALTLVVALNLKGIINSLLLAYTVFTSGVVLPVIAGFYKDKLKVNSIGAITAIIAGGGTALAVKQLHITHLDLFGQRIGHAELLGFVVCAVLLFGVSWITRRIGSSSPRRTLSSQNG